MRYDGGKDAMGVAQWIINQIPPHRVYIEPFLGGGAVLRLKAPGRPPSSVCTCTHPPPAGSPGEWAIHPDAAAIGENGEANFKRCSRKSDRALWHRPSPRRPRRFLPAFLQFHDQPARELVAANKAQARAHARFQAAYDIMAQLVVAGVVRPRDEFLKIEGN